MRIVILSVFLIYALQLNGVAAEKGPFKHPPVILVPGDGGSQVEAKIEGKKQVPHYFCWKNYDWFPIWLSIEQLAPFVIDCFIDNMKLIYDPVTRKTSNAQGVQIRLPGWSYTYGVEWLDAGKLSVTSYFVHIVDTLVAAGYQRNVSIRGAPYDFRKAPNEMQDFLIDLKTLIEKVYAENGNRAVSLLGHSMGNLYTLYLLQRQSQEWKDKYIHSFVSLAGPFAGAAKTLRLMASGDNLGVILVEPLSARPEQRSMPSTAWMLPHRKFWNDSEILVDAHTGQYSAKDYKKFFTDIQFQQGWMMREDTRDLLDPLKPPGVTVYCLHGSQVPTPAHFTYTKKYGFNARPVVKYGEGDGTVNDRSLKACLEWRKYQKQKVYHREFPKSDHMMILDDNNVKSYIKDLLVNS